jgi:hypothetical protein
MNSNLVHCYITGFKFKNIYGGETDDFSRSIMHMKYLDPMTAQKFPMIRNQWKLSDHAISYGYFDTLKEAKAEAQRIWPGCGFKTPEEFRAEEQEVEYGQSN